MIARAESSIFWPGMTKDIAATRDRCTIRDSFIPYGTPSLPMGSHTPSLPTADQNSRHRSLEPSWNGHHRISSAYHPHAKCRVEVGMKSMKCLIAGNTSPRGTLTDSFHEAMLTYTETTRPNYSQQCACLDNPPEISSQAIQPSTCPTAPGETR